MNKASDIKGISVIICCYNSSHRIFQTLDALAKQKCKPDTLWEVILVDNASTDNTGKIALTIWEQFQTGIELRVVSEPEPGLGNARRKGYLESSFSVLLFCDDDNWLYPDYVQGIFDAIESDSSYAAYGGMGIPVFETEEPKWFYEYAETYALGSQMINNENGVILNLYGAGLAVQKQALQNLYESEFVPLLQDRTGSNLSSSGDTELTYSFCLMGYKLGYADELKFFHYLPKERLTFDYIKRIFVSFGNDGPIRNLYYSYISNRFFHKLIKIYYFHLALTILRLFKYFIFPPKKYGRIVYFNWSVAYLEQLLQLKKRYNNIKSDISKIKKRKNYEVRYTSTLSKDLTYNINGR